MTLLGPSLLVSIPGAQLDGLDLPGSVFSWRHLRDAVLAPELRIALNLLVENAAARGTELRFVARPEIFTHGASRAWLDERLGDARDHLALTDGHTLRTISGLRNHAFLYARGAAGAEKGLHRLFRVAPELFAGLSSQVNGALAVRLGTRWVRPPTLMLRFRQAPAEDRAIHAPFGVPMRDAARAGKECAEAALASEDAPPPGRMLHFIPLSDAALADAPFATWLAQLVQRCALANGPECLLLGLPRCEGDEAGPAEAISSVLRALLATGAVLPRARSWGVRFTDAAPLPEAMEGGCVTLHPATSFWRFAPSLFASAWQVQVAGCGPLARFRDLISGFSGREVTTLRLRGQSACVSFA